MCVCVCCVSAGVDQLAERMDVCCVCVCVHYVYLHVNIVDLSTEKKTTID